MELRARWPWNRLMIDPTIEIDLVVRGVTVGSAFTIGAGSWRHGTGWSERLATVLFCAGVAAWDLSSSPVIWAALGHLYLLLLPAFAAVGFFWIFVVVLFEDRKVSLIALAPAGILIILSVLAGMTPPPVDQVIWGMRDLVAGAVAVHAAAVILRSWRGDLGRIHIQRSYSMMAARWTKARALGHRVESIVM